MGPDQPGVPALGTLVPKKGEHTLRQRTLLVISPWSSKQPICCLPKVITSGQFPCTTWSTRHTVAPWSQT